jgi:hypothetical protein
VRVSEHRYSRDLRRIHLAQRLIGHQVRSRWVSTWSGLSVRRVRNLYLSYLASQPSLRRLRGPAPRNPLIFLRYPLLHMQASVLAGFADRFGIIPAQPLANAAVELVSLDVGERLCRAFELFKHAVPGATFTLEQFMALVVALAEQKDLTIGYCEDCQGVLLVDCLGQRRRQCPVCVRERYLAPIPELPLESPPQAPAEAYQQQSLF